MRSPACGNCRREEADRRFLELMIRHHEGSVEMARAGVELGEQPVVRDLAEAILTSQQAEVEAMEELLRREPVSLDEGLEEAAPYAGPNGATYPVLADPDRRRGAAYPVANVPTHLRIDRDGIVREFALAALNRGQRVERAAAILASLVGA
jgi:hypothetical protein